MKIFFDRDSNTITLSEFYENHLLKKYNYDPPGQRKSVWNDQKKSFLIDSILKNFPIPPIFLRRIINDSGRTTYDVIDGKQRLFSIVQFIENKIPLPDDFGSDEFGNEELNSSYFKTLDEYSDLKRHFWKYAIPVEYISTNFDKTIDYVFDRLNRNGEPLTHQELRNARYHSTALLVTIKELSNLPYWKERLKNLEINRMEDLDFISEILFTLLEDQIFDSSPDVINDLYDKWSKVDFNEQNMVDAITRFKEITHYLEQLDLDYQLFRISGVSHLYGLWCFAMHCIEKEISTAIVKPKLENMFTALKERKLDNEAIQNYRKSMNARTKSRSVRVNRLNAIIDYCEAQL